MFNFLIKNYLCWDRNCVISELNLISTLSHLFPKISKVGFKMKIYYFNVLDTLGLKSILHVAKLREEMDEFW